MFIGLMWLMYKYGFFWWEVWVRCIFNFIFGSLFILISKGFWVLLIVFRLMINILLIEFFLNNCVCLYVFRLNLLVLNM